MIESVTSKNGIPIRLTDERWAHITDEHCKLAGMRLDVLETVVNPARVLLEGNGELLAVREFEPGMSRDLIVAGHQQITQEWWNTRSRDFNIYVSQLVVREAGGGDPDAAQRRLSALADIRSLETNQQVVDLANMLVLERALPATSAEDGVHIAVASVHEMDYLLTWNCKHIANAEIRKAIDTVCRNAGYSAPSICTPEELLGD